MRLNLLITLNENFGIKVFAAFTLFIFIISFSFTSFFIHRQGKSLRESLIKNGRLLARILAHNSRIGVFSENEELLRGPVEGIFQQGGVLEVSVFNLEGELLTKQERPEIRTPGKSVKGDGMSRNMIFEKLKESLSPFYLEGNSKVEFWSPVISVSGYSVEESLFLEEDLPQRKGRIIGFVRITVDKDMLNKRLNDLLVKSILIWIAFLMIGSGVSYFGVKGITKPLNRLTEGVKTLGMGGVVKKVPIETKDEIGRLAKAFNDMSKSLNKRERALRESEEKYRDLYDNAPVMYHTIDTKGIVLDCNQTEADMLGYSKEEIIGKPIYTFQTKKYQDLAPHALREGMEKGHVVGERRFVKKDGRIIDTAFEEMAIHNDSGKTVGFRSTVTDITHVKQAEEELQKSQEELRNLADHLQSVREEERTTIAREIHDDLGQTLTALKMDISWLGKKLPKDQETLLEKTKAMRKITDMTIKSVKRISTELRPGLLDDLGLVAAIEWQTEEFQNRMGMRCKLVVHPEDITVEEKRSTALFRILQETLTNVARHAQATTVSVSLKEKDGNLELRVRDNGRGITKEQISDPKSFGLMGIRERAHPLGGKVKITGKLGEGTTVVVSIPIETG